MGELGHTQEAGQVPASRMLDCVGAVHPPAGGALVQVVAEHVVVRQALGPARAAEIDAAIADGDKIEASLVDHGGSQGGARAVFRAGCKRTYGPVSLA